MSQSFNLKQANSLIFLSQSLSKQTNSLIFWPNPIILKQAHKQTSSLIQSGNVQFSREISKTPQASSHLHWLPLSPLHSHPTGPWQNRHCSEKCTAVQDKRPYCCRQKGASRRQLCYADHHTTLKPTRIETAGSYKWPVTQCSARFGYS